MPRSVIVIGLGAMGSAAAQQLAQRGHRVIGLDQFTPPHSYGSSHGQTRITRQSYWEDSRYVPLLLRAYELWRKLERDTGQSLLELTGGLMIGPSSGDLVSRSAASAEQFGLPHKLLSDTDLKRDYPAFATTSDTVALWERNAGYLFPEACIQQQLHQAAKAGADLRFNEQVIDWQASAGEVSVRTSFGTRKADHLVITAGPWAPQVLAAMQLPLTVTRQVLCWFEPLSNPEFFSKNRFPVFLHQAANDPTVLYGFPSIAIGQQGVKVALHGSTHLCTPEDVNRRILPEDEQTIRHRLAQSIPLLPGRLLHAETCLYTMTPDEHFILDTHPQHANVTLAAGFSGHGFKFASVIGEVLADLAVHQKPAFDLGLFAIQRFAPSALDHP